MRVTAQSDDLSQWRSVVSHVGDLDSDMRRRTEGELRGLRHVLAQRLVDGQATDAVMVEGFAAVREAARRVLGVSIDDEALAAGAALSSGRVVDISDAENRSLVSALPAYVGVLSGEKVHVAGMDDTLARRGAGWVAGPFDALGVRVGLLCEPADQDDRKYAYESDVTYGCYRQFGFDYLRDSLAYYPDECVQRAHHMAIVDEVDSILVDQADEVMTMSGPLAPDVEQYQKMAETAAALERGIHYEIDAGTGAVSLTDAGAAVADSLRPEGNDVHSAVLVRHLEDAIRAKEWYRRDKDYAVVDGEIVVLPGSHLRDVRRYGAGVRQAIEAREELRISEHAFVRARVAVRDYFRLYERLSGMSATAAATAEELEQMYQLKVVPPPTRRPPTRVDHPDVVYERAQTRLGALIAEAVERHAGGQPVLIRTLTVEDGEAVGQALDERGIGHAILKPEGTERTAHVMARAGRPGAVTVLAGVTARGYDVRLGGDAFALADEKLQSRGADEDGPAVPGWMGTRDAVSGELASAGAADRDDVIKAGGLAVLGARHHASPRADKWLRGLAGQRGDPGESRFFLSMEDSPLRGLDSLFVRMIPRRLRERADGAPAARLVARVIADAQQRSEQSRRERRMQSLAFEDVEGPQREQIYAERRQFRDGSDLSDRTVHLIDQVLDAYAEKYQDPEELLSALGRLYETELGGDDLVGQPGEHASDSARLRARLRADAHAAYRRREALLGTPIMRELERRVMLSVLDDNWRRHLAELDAIRDGLAPGRKDPGDLVLDYRREAGKRYQALRERVRERAVDLLFHIERS